jgi:hypothetical protein
MRAPQRLFLPGALVVLILAGCGSSMSQSDGSGAPLASSSQAYAEPSESEEPSVPAQPPGQADVTGTWDGTWLIDPPYETVAGGFTMELTQSGSSFSGPLEVTNTDCMYRTVQGTLDGSSITFGWVGEDQPVQFTGTITGFTMSGTWSSQACSDPNISLTGTWEATKL